MDPSLRDAELWTGRFGISCHDGPDKCVDIFHQCICSKMQSSGDNRLDISNCVIIESSSRLRKALDSSASTMRGSVPLLLIQ